MNLCKTQQPSKKRSPWLAVFLIIGSLGLCLYGKQKFVEDQWRKNAGFSTFKSHAKTVTPQLTGKPANVIAAGFFSDPGKKIPAKNNVFSVLIEQNNLCAMLSAIENKSDAFEERPLAALLADPGFTEDYISLLPAAGAGTGSESQKNPRPITSMQMFFLALRLSGLLSSDSSYPVQLDLGRANQLLLDLENSDSENAAFPFFRIAVAKKMNVTEDALLEILRDAARKSKFDSFLAQLRRKIFTNGFVNTTAWFLSHAIQEKMAIPNYSASNSILVELIKKYGPLTEADALGALMMQEGLGTNLSDIEGGYLAVEYEIGKNLLKRNSKPDSSPVLASYRDLERERLQRRFGNPGIFDAESAKVYSMGAKNCDPAKAEKLFQATKELFRDSL